MKREDRRQAIVDLLIDAREIELDDLARRFAERIVGMRGGRIAFDMAVEELSDGATANLYRETVSMSGIGLRAVT